MFTYVIYPRRVRRNWYVDFIFW